MVELKARVDTLDQVRKRTLDLGAHHVGIFQQTDVYFNVPKGRLKLREVKGTDKAELVYYERENTSGPKRSDIFILQIEKPAVFKGLLERILEAKVTVEKLREIYRYQGTQIHLDIVERLGNFVEFERKTPNDVQVIKENKRVLESLMKKLGIKQENLEELSYCDLIQKRDLK